MKGIDGEQVLIPKGTQAQIQHWSIHRSKKHWGPTADVFDPEREFVDNELWHGAGFKASNPRTERFLPFTHTPRQCLCQFVISCDRASARARTSAKAVGTEREMGGTAKAS